jgi:endonuclease-3 related protein
MQERPENQIAAMYSTLSRAWGRQHWWPAETAFEVIVGAFLTQNTNWSNVERALAQLRDAKVLSVAGIRKIKLRQLEQLIRSSGYFRQKAARLKNFVEFLDRHYRGSLARMFAQPTSQLREELLALNGIGPETADSILLYAGQHPVFVVDAYTKRIATRHAWLPERATYEEIRLLFERDLSDCKVAEHSSGEPERAVHPPSRMSLAARSPQAQVFNEVHGLIVGIGKKHCLKSAPKCEACPLHHLLPSQSGCA